MKYPIATIETTHGKILVELYPDKAPNTVRSFIWLAQKGLFDQRKICRIVPGFVIQPSYTSFDDPRCEINLSGEYAANGFVNRVPFQKCTVAMGGEGKIASGSCFFITLSDEAGQKLDGHYAAFGKVVSGWEEVERLENVETSPVETGVPGVTVNEPVEPEIIVQVSIETWGISYPPPDIL